MSDKPDIQPNAEQSLAMQWESARRQLGEGCLSIIMPSYRLGEAIAGNIEHVRSVFEGYLPYEVIPVDDGSDDNTGQRLAEMAALHDNVRPVYLIENSGKGAALREGFAETKGNYVLLLDGDLDLPPSQVSGFFKILEDNDADVVIGSKRHRDSNLNYPLPRVIMSNLYYLLVKMLVGLPVRDTQTGIKLFKREVLSYVFPRMLVKRFAFDLEILSIAHEKGFSIAEAPITLDFKCTGWGCARPKTVRRIINDTLAIFYRLRILRYYQNLDVD